MNFINYTHVNCLTVLKSFKTRNIDRSNRKMQNHSNNNIYLSYFEFKLLCTDE